MLTIIKFLTRLLIALPALERIVKQIVKAITDAIEEKKSKQYQDKVDVAVKEAIENKNPQLLEDLLNGKK